MTNELLCNYAILRFLPYKETGEFVNVGVAVHCPEIDLFDFKLAAAQNRRVRQFFPELNRGVYKSALDVIAKKLNKHRNVEELFTNQRALNEGDITHGLTTFRMLLQRREALLHFASPGTLLSDPRTAADELFKRYIERQFAREPEYQEQAMRKNLGRWMKQWGVRNLYETDVKVGDDMFHLRLPFARLVDSHVTRAVKPLDLVRPEPTKVFEHGDLWMQRMRRLEQRHCLPAEMIFPVSVPASGPTADAARQVLRDLEGIGNVKWVPFDENDERLREALVELP